MNIIQQLMIEELGFVVDYIIHADNISDIPEDIIRLQIKLYQGGMLHIYPELNITMFIPGIKD